MYATRTLGSGVSKHLRLSSFNRDRWTLPLQLGGEGQPGGRPRYTAGGPHSSQRQDLPRIIKWFSLLQKRPILMMVQSHRPDRLQGSTRTELCMELDQAHKSLPVNPVDPDAGTEVRGVYRPCSTQPSIKPSPSTDTPPQHFHPGQEAMEDQRYEALMEFPWSKFFFFF